MRRSISEPKKDKVKTDSNELGLEFFTTVEKGWPQNFSTGKLVEGIEARKFKWKFTNNKIHRRTNIKENR